MNNFIINTDELTEDNIDQHTDFTYCTNCKSCGILGCECWYGCSAMYCKYGDDLIEDYEQDKKDTNKWFTMLVELGIENPCTMDVERIKQLANILIWEYVPIDGNIKNVISHHYNNLKDDEEE